LHGSGFTADTYATTSDALHLAARGAIVVMPEAVIPFRLNPAWPWGFAWNVPNSPLPGESSPRQQPDDVAFIRAVLAACPHRYPGLPVHLMGYSGGARLASYVAATESNLASVGLVAGVRFPNEATATPPMLAIHGQRDTINPYAGSNNARWGAGVQTVARCWARAAGCLERPQLHVIMSGVQEERFAMVNGLSPVRLVSLTHVGHAWPGSTDAEHIAQFGDAGPWSASHWLGHFFEEVEARFVVATLPPSV
jgi:polyhydroxybutyrate depolymerase